MRILAVCNYGQNRSRYLADLLSKKGFETDYAGVKMTPPAELQQKIDAADVVVALEPSVRQRLEDEYTLEGKKLFGLDVAFQTDGHEMRQEIEEQMQSSLIDFL